MYPINEVNNMSGLASVLGGEIGALPTTYLVHDVPVSYSCRDH